MYVALYSPFEASHGTHLALHGRRLSVGSSSHSSSTSTLFSLTILDCANQNLGILPIQDPVPLRFPPFYPSVTQTNVWDAADQQGRIMIEISEGYVDVVDGEEVFVKLKNYVLFNFQPAPLGMSFDPVSSNEDADTCTEVLKRVGIAWPNPVMFENPLPAREVGQQQSSSGLYPEVMAHVSNVKHNIHGHDMAHRRNFSVNSVESSYFSSPVFSGNTSMPGPPPPTPAMSMTYGISPGSICDDSSRSTSAYSTIPYSSLPILNDQFGQLGDHHSATSQVKAYLSNINISSSNRTSISTIPCASYESHSMPPPPLPQHAVDAKVIDMPDCSAITSPEPRTAPQEPQVMQNGVDRRKESRSNESDISMHAGCTGYPDCTSEDTNGHIVHTPSAVVQGRKEGNGNGKSKYSTSTRFWGQLTDGIQLVIGTICQ